MSVRIIITLKERHDPAIDAEFGRPMNPVDLHYQEHEERPTIYERRLKDLLRAGFKAAVENEAKCGAAAVMRMHERSDKHDGGSN